MAPSPAPKTIQDWTNMQFDDHTTLIRVETKMDSLTNEMRQTNAASLAVTSDHEARIRVLEVDRDRNLGSRNGSDKVKNTLFAVIGICVGIITSYATYIAAVHPK